MEQRLLILSATFTQNNGAHVGGHSFARESGLVAAAVQAVMEELVKRGVDKDTIDASISAALGPQDMASMLETDNRMVLGI